MESHFKRREFLANLLFATGVVAVGIKDLPELMTQIDIKSDIQELAHADPSTDEPPPYPTRDSSGKLTTPSKSGPVKPKPPPAKKESSKVAKPPTTTTQTKPTGKRKGRQGSPHPSGYSIAPHHF